MSLTALHVPSVRRADFQVAGMTVQVEADLPIVEGTFVRALMAFRVEAPGSDLISLAYHFAMPALVGPVLGHEVYRRSPWAIYRAEDAWRYLGILPPELGPDPFMLAVFNRDHTRGDIYVPGAEVFRRGHLSALTLFPTDQILFARLLADRQACYLHGAGMVLDGQGFVFSGHSGAGKSTIVTQLRDAGQILCDDRIVVRRWPDGFRVHGTWSHGDVPDVFPGSAPLRAILFLEQSRTNRLSPQLNPREVARTLPSLVVRPLATPDWWQKILALVETIAREVPVYRLQFDLSGGVRELLRQL